MVTASFRVYVRGSTGRSNSVTTVHNKTNNVLMQYDAQSSGIRYANILVERSPRDRRMPADPVELPMSFLSMLVDSELMVLFTVGE